MRTQCIFLLGALLFGGAVYADSKDVSLPVERVRVACGDLSGVRIVFRRNQNEWAISEITLPNGGQSDEDVARLANVSELRCLKIMDDAPNYANISPHGLEQLSRLKELRHLRLPRKVTPLHLKAIGRVESLMTLDLTFCNEVGSEGLGELARLSNLKGLIVQEVGLTDAAIDKISQLTTLEKLDVSNNSISDVGLKKIIGLQALRELNVCNTGVDGRGLAALALLRSIERLSIGGHDGAISGLDLSRFHSLKCVNYGVDVGEGDFGRNIPRNLEGIRAPVEVVAKQEWGSDGQHIRACEIYSYRYNVDHKATVRQVTSRFPHLTRLVVEGALVRNLRDVVTTESISEVVMKTAIGVSDGDIVNVEWLKDVESVRIMNAYRIGDDGLAALGKIEGLQQLELLGMRRNAVSADGVAHIGGLKHLRRLVFGWAPGETCVISEDVFSAMRHMHGLESLSIDGAEISKAGLTAIAEAKRLRVLGLTNCSGFTIEDASRLVRELPNLQTLEMTYCRKSK